MRTEDAITRPLLRIRDVAVRGALYGLAAVSLLGVASLFVGDHHDRTTFLGAVGLFAAFTAVVGILIGLVLWSACGGDIRRCRDWHTVTSQAGPATVAAPVLADGGRWTRRCCCRRAMSARHWSYAVRPGRSPRSSRAAVSATGTG
ncbi:DUF6336 family protein [Streptomyces sp. NPDC086080]|uniref:DUF6336 family protein n=1 Tax=Streptomyces sp. NPDC086080 TaxID=3365748 RepID=UPI0037CD4DC8